MLLQIARTLLALLLLGGVARAQSGAISPPGPLPTLCPGGQSATGYTSYGQPLNCGNPVGTGTINSGTTGQIAIYPGSGTTIGPESLAALIASFPSSSITNTMLANSTISGIALGGNLDTLTFGTHLTGTSYNGSAAVSLGIDATSANTASTIVARDGSGNFSAGTITANLTGHASLDLPLTGGTLSGELTTLASATGSAGLNLPPGTAPTSPNNGDIWVTTAGLYVQINGVTVGPLSTGGGSSAFSAITSGTNTTAAMVMGSGGSLATSGSGTIAATSVPAAGVASGALANGMTATTQTVGDNSPKLATDAFVIANAGGGSSTITEGTTPTSGFTNTYLMTSSGSAVGQVAPNLSSFSATDSTHTTSVAIANIGGQDNYNGSSLTATVPSTSTAGNGQSFTVTNQNASTLTLSGGQTLNGLASATTLHAYGFASCLGNGTTADCIGFPGYGTIATNALTKFIDGSGATTASSMVDNGSGVVVGGATGGAEGAGTINATNLYVGGVAVGTPGGSSNSVQYNASSSFGGISLGAGQLLVGQTGTPAAEPVSGDATLSAGGALTVTKSNGTAFGTAAFDNTGTSGATIPLLNASNTFSAGQAIAPTNDGTQSAGGTLTMDLSASNNHTATFGAGNLTIANPSNIKAGECGFVALTQDSVGTRTASWGTDWHWPGGNAPALSSAASATDVVQYCATTSSFLAASLSIQNVQ